MPVVASRWKRNFHDAFDVFAPTPICGICDSVEYLFVYVREALLSILALLYKSNVFLLVVCTTHNRRISSLRSSAVAICENFGGVNSGIGGKVVYLLVTFSFF